jgi:hypothetical protein
LVTLLIGSVSVVLIAALAFIIGEVVAKGLPACGPASSPTR